MRSAFKIIAMFRCCLFMITLVLFSQGLPAQEPLKGRYVTQYLFPEFTEGIVFQKGGSTYRTMLNYNTLTDEVLFQQDGQQMALANVQSVESVTIGDRKFVPVEKSFYEVVTKTPVALCVERHSEIVPLGAETGFGRSQTASISRIEDLKSSGMAYSLKLPDDFKITTKTTFWLKRGDKYKLIKSANDVKNEFINRAPQIDAYLKNNKVNFKSEEDLKKLVEFCNQV